MSMPKYGQLVVVSRWRDFDFPMDAVFLGKFDRYDDGYWYVQEMKRGFKHCRKVSRQEIKLKSIKD